MSETLEQIKTKKCSKCKCVKSVTEFYVDSNGIYPSCKKCKKETVSSRRKTINGFVEQLYINQKHRSLKNGFPPPTYTKNELKDWLLSQERFKDLWDNYIKSKYNKWLSPSCDRKDDYSPYSFDNLTLTTWKENFDKGQRDRKNGTNNKVSKAVVGVHITTGEVVEFHSAMEAYRKTGIFNTNISSCCRGVKNKSHAGGYKWSFKNV